MTEQLSDADTPPDTPQIYLITPPDLELSIFPDLLARVMDSVEIACLRLTLATTDEDRISRTADLIREQAHARDIPLVIDTHYRMIERLGLDGVHLTDGQRSVRTVRKEVGPDVVVGAFCGASRHDGVSAGDAGADYIAYGPMTDTELGTGDVADHDIFSWWSEMIELPVVAEGALDVKTVETLAPVTDFFAIGPEIWGSDDPVATLKALVAPLG